MEETRRNEAMCPNICRTSVFYITASVKQLLWFLLQQIQIQMITELRKQ